MTPTSSVIITSEVYYDSSAYWSGGCEFVLLANDSTETAVYVPLPIQSQLPAYDTAAGTTASPSISMRDTKFDQEMISCVAFAAIIPSARLEFSSDGSAQSAFQVR